MGKGQSIFLFEMPEILNLWNFLTVPTFALGFYEVVSVDLPLSEFKQVEKKEL